MKTRCSLAVIAAALLTAIAPAMADNTGITTQVPASTAVTSLAASDVTVADAGLCLAAANVETALAELAAEVGSCTAPAANRVFAGPTTGPAAAPTFRALVAADIPALGYVATGGNAGTATALAANGANCSAGSYPLGVDASGAVESCTVAGGGGIAGSVGSTDNAIPRADGTGGGTLQSSTATIDDSGYLTATRFQVDGAFAAFRNDGGYVRLDTQLNVGSFSRGAVWHVDYPSVDAEVRLSYCWANDYDWIATKDLCVKRNAVGVFEVNGGSTSVGGAVLVRPLASPPATCNAAAEGMEYTDTSHAKCWCDGTTWTVLAGAGTCA